MRIARITTALLATAAGFVFLAGCTSQPDVQTTPTTTSATTTAPATPTVDQAAIAAQSSAEAERVAAVAAAAEAEAERVAAEQATTVAAEAERVAAEQAAAVAAEAERVAAESAAAEQAAAEAEAQPEEWYEDDGWVSPQTAARALEAGIPFGGDIPGYLRCGTMCGESPTSGEMQMVNGCADGYIPASECSAQGISGGGPEREPCYVDSWGNCQATQDEANQMSQQQSQIAEAEECQFAVNGACVGYDTWVAAGKPQS